MKQKTENIIDKNKVLNSFIYLSILFFLIVGLIIYKDFGISVDEPFQRASGYYWYLWILENYSNNSENIETIKNNFYKMEWSNALRSGEFIQYGPFFDTFVVFLENKIGLIHSKEIYQLKHLINFLVFYLSSIFFFLIIKSRFNNNFLGFLGFLLYVTSPRIFASSFYNSKDIIFMSLTVISIYFALKLLKKFKFKNILFFALFAGIATSIRIPGVFYTLLLFVFLAIMNFEKKITFNKKYLPFILIGVFYLLFTYLFWPYLWSNPIENFFKALAYFNKIGWGGSVFYLGEFIKATDIPWHYTIVWIFITLPLTSLILFLIGTYFVLLKFSKNFLNFENKTFEKNFWSNHHEKIDFFIILCFFIPIFSVIIFNSTLYNSWRHLYFLYPFLIYTSITGFSLLMNINIKLRKFFTVFFFVSIFSNIFTIYKLHPFQNIYFNFLAEKNANKLFVIDYWGLGNKHSLEKIIEKSNDKNISIGNASFSPLEYSRYMLDKDKTDKVIFSGNAKFDQDYIFTNFVFDSNPKHQRKYNIPKNYEKIFELRKGNILINEVYIKKSE